MAVISVIASALLTLRVWRLYTQKITEINKILVFSITAFTFTILFESYRLLAFNYIGPIDDFSYQLYFIISVFLILFAVSIGLRAVFILNRQSGHPIKHEVTIRAIITVLFISISLINVFTSDPTSPNELGLISYQMDPILAYIMILLYLPVLFYVITKTRVFSKKIQDKKLSKLLTLFFTFFLGLSLDRGFSICRFSAFPNTVNSLISGLVILNIVLCSLLAIFYSNPDFLNRISSYFCVKSLYLIKRKGGQVIYHNHFSEDVLVKTLTPNTLLLGGFIHAVSHGLKQTLRNGGEMETIKVGDLTLIFKSGKHILGLIFANEPSPILPLNLFLFMQRFETTYELELERWKGNLRVFDSQLINNWTIEIFR